MENRENRDPTGQEADITKVQSAQQPQSQAGQQPESGEQLQPAELGQDLPAGSPDEGLQGETATQQRTDVEGASLGAEEDEESESGFVGSKGDRDTSGLIEDEDFEKDDEGE